MDKDLDNETPTALGDGKSLGQAKRFDVHYYSTNTGKPVWSHKYKEEWERLNLFCPRCGRKNGLARNRSRRLLLSGIVSLHILYRNAYAKIKALYNEAAECLIIARGIMAQDNCNCSEAEFKRINAALKKAKSL